MPLSVVYATVNGVLVEEDRGGAVTCYVPDTLGSVVKTTDAAGSVTSATTYWPFGEARTSAGANPSPWGFVGTLGYYKDALVRLYVRARTYRADLDRWMSVDPLWPEEKAYGYVENAPSYMVDASGRGMTPAERACKKACGVLGKSYIYYELWIRVGVPACKITLIHKYFCLCGPSWNIWTTLLDKLKKLGCNNCAANCSTLCGFTCPSCDDSTCAAMCQLACYLVCD